MPLLDHHALNRGGARQRGGDFRFEQECRLPTSSTAARADLHLDNLRNERHMSRMVNPASSSDRTRRYRDGLRRRGLRPVQIWIPDLRAPGLAAEIQRQCERINAADRLENLMTWVEDVSVFDENDAA